MSAARIFIPRDSAALSLGADALARNIAQEAERRGVQIDIVRTGSRGMFWLEPLVEVETQTGRHGYGPVGLRDIAGLFDAGFLAGGAHPKALGPVEKLDWMTRQNRVTFARVGVTDPLSLDDYRAHGGLKGLAAALEKSGAEIVEQVRVSGLRGRGGAAFPAGVKWKSVHDAAADAKYIVCNADEGDSGTVADRLLMEGDPFLLIEGMAIAARAVGASKGFIYSRSEYPDAFHTICAAIGQAEDAGVLGPRAFGADRGFRIEARLGAGAYICGEETALLESLEGRRGVVRAKPPLPAIRGFLGKPTVVNNALTFAAVPAILADGPQAYAEYGVGRSRGTMAFQLAGNVKRGGLVELPFGATLRDLVEDFGGGSRSGRPIRAVQVGGPLGAYLPPSQFDTPLDYEAFASIGAMLGHGGIVVFDDSVDMARQARFAFEFCAKESCGKCTPCRIGAVRGAETVDKIVRGERRDDNLALLDDLNRLMSDGSLCAMGGLTPMPVMSALRHFPEDFRRMPEQAAE
ncbi:MAG: formate dehydrogenase beta subunit [Rhodoblastus sp.]